MKDEAAARQKEKEAEQQRKTDEAVKKHQEEWKNKSWETRARELDEAMTRDANEYAASKKK